MFASNEQLARMTTSRPAKSKCVYTSIQSIIMYVFVVAVEVHLVSKRKKATDGTDHY